MTNILVTGGAGYIGSHACKALKTAGYTPVTYDNLITGWQDAVKFGPFEPGDLADRARLDQVFDQYKPAAVMHFAALSQVGEAMSEPGRYWRGNVCASLILIEAAVAAGCLDFVFSSTCATYGEHDNVVLDEITAQLPLNAYGASKRAIEDMLRDFEAAHGLRSVVFRYFNVAGAYGTAGENRVVETHLIPLVLQVALGHRDEIKIFGDDWPTPDGTCIRDYIHVADLADAHLLALESNSPGTHRILNLGSGEGFSVREVIDVCREVTGHPIPDLVAPRRAGDPAVLVASSEKAIAKLGWKPTRTGLRTIVEDAWAFTEALGDRAHSAPR